MHVMKGDWLSIMKKTDKDTDKCVNKNNDATKKMERKQTILPPQDLRYKLWYRRLWERCKSFIRKQHTHLSPKNERQKVPWYKKAWHVWKSLFGSGSSDIPAVFRYPGGFLFLISQFIRLSRELFRLGESINYFSISFMHLAFTIGWWLYTGNPDTSGGLADVIRETRILITELLKGLGF